MPLTNFLSVKWNSTAVRDWFSNLNWSFHSFNLTVTVHLHGISSDVLKSEYSDSRQTDVVPILFNEAEISPIPTISGFSLKDMPTEFIALVVGKSSSLTSGGNQSFSLGLFVGVAVLIAAGCVCVIVVLLVRHKKSVANLPYSDYGGFAVVPKKEFQLVHSSLDKIRRSGSDHFGIFDLEVEPHDRLPLTAPPKRVPSGFSPPPDYSYSRVGMFSVNK